MIHKILMWALLLAKKIDWKWLAEKIMDFMTKDKPVKVQEEEEDLKPGTCISNRVQVEEDDFNPEPLTTEEKSALYASMSNADLYEARDTARALGQYHEIFEINHVLITRSLKELEETIKRLEANIDAMEKHLTEEEEKK